MEGFVVKTMKNGLGEWGVWWGVEKANKLAYKRFFKTEEMAKKWTDKFTRKMLKK